jgi:hypothetical protein
MRYVLIVIVAGLLLLVPTGCEDTDPGGDNRNIVGSGPVVTKTLSLDTFSKIENTGVADIHVTVGEPQSVVLKAQQNIIDVMTIGVLGDVLEIGLQSNVSIEKADTIMFDITIPELSSVSLTGVGDYFLSGDYRDAFTIRISGVGNVKAFGLEVGTCNIIITGVGDCEVNVRDVLNVDITGVGNVHYKGQPSISSSISGIGALIDAN